MFGQRRRCRELQFIDEVGFCNPADEPCIARAKARGRHVIFVERVGPGGRRTRTVARFKRVAQATQWLTDRGFRPIRRLGVWTDC